MATAPKTSVSWSSGKCSSNAWAIPLGISWRWHAVCITVAKWPMTTGTLATRRGGNVLLLAARPRGRRGAVMATDMGVGLGLGVIWTESYVCVLSLAWLRGWGGGIKYRNGIFFCVSV